MDASLRLFKIANMVDKCDTVADIGTDHGYVPIMLINNNICNSAIACDINPGPLKKAKLNIDMEGLPGKIKLRLGAGLSVLKENEAQCIIIAGMGGNLIRDILEENIEVAKVCDSLVLQPVQNPEVLREYLYRKGFFIIDEDLCYDENKYYEIIKVKYLGEPKSVESIYYEISRKLIEKKHPLLKEYISKKITSYKNILNNINENTEMAEKRKREINEKLYKLEGILRCI